jgi:hypothetical protein
VTRPKRPKASLDGPIAKVARAQSHLNDFKTHSGFVRAPGTYTFIPKIHRDGLDHIWYLDSPVVVGRDWALMIGDAVHNLRSALDHLAWQLVIANGGGHAITTQFPIHASDTRKNPYTGQIEARPCEVAGGIHPDALDIIKRVQPYNGGDEGDKLWRIHELDVIDKHRYLILSVTSLSWYGRNITDADSEITGRWFARRMEQGKPVLRITYATPQHEINPSFHFGVDIAFDEDIPRLIKQPLHMVVQELVTFTGDFICSFERFL